MNVTANITGLVAASSEPPAGASESMLRALLWLRNRSGDGLFDRNGILVAGGERAGVMRATWNKLRDLGLVEFYLDRRRLRVTPYGRQINLNKYLEADSAAERWER
jgi:hypothetical protein